MKKYRRFFLKPRCKTIENSVTMVAEDNMETSARKAAKKLGLSHPEEIRSSHRSQKTDFPLLERKIKAGETYFDDRKCRQFRGGAAGAIQSPDRQETQNRLLCTVFPNEYQAGDDNASPACLGSPATPSSVCRVCGKHSVCRLLGQGLRIP